MLPEVGGGGCGVIRDDRSDEVGCGIGVTTKRQSGHSRPADKKAGVRRSIGVFA
jgi:hypothetical protein